MQPDSGLGAVAPHKSPPWLGVISGTLRSLLPIQLHAMATPNSFSIGCLEGPCTVFI